MKRRRFSEEQIIGILKEAAAGEPPAIAVCRKHGIAEQTLIYLAGSRNTAAWRCRRPSG